MISHRHKFIFEHVAKTAGCTVEAVFGIKKEQFVNPEQPDDRRHMRLGSYRRVFPDLFDAYFKFAFVRNPWNHRDNMAARLAGLGEQIAAARSIDDARLLGKMLAKLESKRVELASHRIFKPFNEWIIVAKTVRNQLHEDGTDMGPHFDFVGRFERLNEDFRTVCDRIGIKASLPHVNKGWHAHYTSYYDDRTRAIVADKCAHDIERFGYRFGD